MTGVTKAAVIVVAEDERTARDFSITLGKMAVGELKSGGMRPTKSLSATTMYASIKDLQTLLTQNEATADKSFDEADVKIYAAMDRPASELLKEIEQMTQGVEAEGSRPLFCQLDKTIAEYCQTHNIHRLWMHCLNPDSSYVDMTRYLSKSGIMPATVALQTNYEIRRLLNEAAVANGTDSPNKQKFLDDFWRALEFYVQQAGAQGVLVSHWAWPMINLLPRSIYEPYLLSSTEIYLNKLAEMMLSYCKD